MSVHSPEGNGITFGASAHCFEGLKIDAILEQNRIARLGLIRGIIQLTRGIETTCVAGAIRVRIIGVRGMRQ